MSPRRYLRELISDRLTAAAEEIFRAFEKTIDVYEEELERQRKLLEVVYKPAVKLHQIELAFVPKKEAETCMSTLDNDESYRMEAEQDSDPQLLSHGSAVDENQDQTQTKLVEKTTVKSEEDMDSQHRLFDIAGNSGIKIHLTELPQLHVSKEEEEEEKIFKYQKLCEEERDSTLDQEKSESLKTEEDHQGIRISQEKEWVALEETFSLTPDNETGNDPHSLPLSDSEGAEITESSAEIFTTTSTQNQCTELQPGAKPHCCETCGRCFAQKSHLRDHMFIHTGETPYSCQICAKRFNNISLLSRHKRTHSQKRYCCRMCGKGFIKSCSLKYHEQVHTGERPYACKTCGKCFFKKSHLKEHVRVHTGEKPYCCATCGTGFSRSSSLKQHMKVHLDAKPYTCQVYGKGFGDASSLKCHSRTHRS